MAYTDYDFTSKKSLKEAVKAGKHISVYQPGMGTIPANGTVYLEGPHYPEAHTWYATGLMSDGKLVKITK